MNSKKIVFIQKNKGFLLPVEQTLNALDIHQQFPLQDYVSEEIFQHFQNFQNSINTVAQIANHLNLPLKELSLNRDFLEKWLLEEEGKLNNGRPET